MPIDNTKINRYYLFIHFGESLIEHSELNTLQYTFGEETEPSTGLTSWVDYPRRNATYDSEYRTFEIDYSIYAGNEYGGILYYTHDPGGATLIHNRSWVWVKFTVGGNEYIGGNLIGEEEASIDYPREDTQYIATHIYIDPAPGPEPPTPPADKKYKIWVLKENSDGSTVNITDENIWVGNTPGDGKSKQTSGTTQGEEYAYVEFTWDELKSAHGG